jgi:hypothetical protein
MTFERILPVWQAVSQRFHKMVRELPEEDLTLSAGPLSIGYMLRHNAEVEYMFAEWFFAKKMPDDLEILTNRGAAAAQITFTNLTELVTLLEASNHHLTEAMRTLPEEAWDQEVHTPIGSSTPLEAVGRLLYHSGIHAGQISLIRKHADLFPSASA